MKLFGIFDKNENYKLLRYSTYIQNESVYEKYNKDTNLIKIVNEICLPEIDYVETYIGKHYDINLKTFID
jgi:hypothetical protein